MAELLVNNAFAEIFGFYPGDTKSQIYRFPIIYNSFRNAFEISGAERLKVITLKYDWPNQYQDMLEAKRRILQEEKEKAKRRSQRYIGSRIVQRGRVSYDSSLLE